VTTRLRLVLLLLALAWSILVGPGRAQAAELARADERRSLAPRILDPRDVRVRAVARKARTATLGVRASRYARRLLGVPYRYGGDSPGSGFDCSGLVRHVFGRFGLELPHSSYADFGLGRSVPRAALRPGDLVFFNGLGHVGLYVGSGRFIHAPRSGTTVRITSLGDPWYSSRYDGARRLGYAAVRKLRRAR
jgi:cell wall-associated NlpC family hydrolase